MSKISRLLSAMKGFGGSKEELQLTSNQQEDIEQPESMPIPKGYSTVMFPHLVSQSALEMLVFVVAGERERRRRRRKREKNAGVRDMVMAYGED